MHLDPDKFGDQMNYENKTKNIGFKGFWILELW